MLVSVSEFKASVYWDDKRASEWTDSKVEQALGFAEGRFLRLTQRARLGYWIAPVGKTLKLHGTGLAEQRCRYPVLGLTSVTSDGEDITADVEFLGHYLFRTSGAAFSEKMLGVIVTGQFGDPHIERNQDLSPVIPGDLSDCLMRMAWHQLRRERIVVERAATRGAGPPPPINAVTDPLIQQTIESWTVRDASRSLDFR